MLAMLGEFNEFDAKKKCFTKIINLFFATARR